MHICHSCIHLCAQDLTIVVLSQAFCFGLQARLELTPQFVTATTLTEACRSIPQKQLVEELQCRSQIILSIQF